MVKEIVVAKVPADEKKGTAEVSASISVDYAQTLVEAKEMFGEEAILTNAFANWRVTLQSNIRAGLRKGESPESIAVRLAGAKMGVAAIGAKVDARQVFLNEFAAASPEKQAEMILELKARAAKVKAA